MSDGDEQTRSSGPWEAIAQQLARLTEPVDLHHVFGDLAPFDTLDLLSKLAGLQLIPENADYLIRLEAACHYAVGKAPVLDGPRVGRQRLLRALTADAVNGGSLGMNEDPNDNLLTESLTTVGRSYIVFPGIVEGAIYILRNLSKALFLHSTPFPDPTFTAEAAKSFRLLLTLTDAVARRAQMGRHVEPRRSRGLTIPASGLFNTLTRAVAFTLEECDGLLRPRGLTTADLAPFVSTPGSVNIAEYSVSDGDLHRRPLVRVGQHLIVSEPGILAATLRHAVLLGAAERRVLGQVATRFRDAVWDNVIENLRYLGLRHILLTLPSLGDGAVIVEGVFDLDRDKALYVQLVTDPLDEYEADQVFGTWNSGRLGDILDTRAHEVERWLLSQADHPNEILVLTVLGDVGRQVTLGIGSKAEPLLSLQLAILAYDLETIALLEGGNPLALLQFARAYQGIRERTEIQSSSILDEFDLYRHNGHSYYFSDDALPNLISIAPGSAGAVRRDAAKQRDRHGVPSFREGYVVEVTCLYDSDVPIYVPFSMEFERVAILVERLPIPVWVVCPRRDDVPPQLRGIYWDLAETIAYWLWQCTPVVQPLLEQAGPSRRRLSVHVQLRGDGDWTRLTDGVPTPFRECVRTCLDHGRGVLSLEFAPSVIGHFGGSDNRGERELVRLLLESLSQLMSQPVDKPGIDRAVESYAPLGLKKKLIVFDAGKNPLLDPKDLPEYRKVQEFQTNRISDEIAAFLETRGKSPGLVAKSDRVPVINDVVAYLYRRLVHLVETVRSGELLPWLIHQHEGLTRRMFYQRLTLPTREACFGQTGNMARDVARELMELYAASRTVRFLIELVAAQPPTGVRPVSLDLFDELMALAGSIINWGSASDYLRFGILDFDLSVLPSGRLGAPREHFERARDAFMELHAAGQIGRAKGWFPRHWRSGGPTERGGSSQRLLDQLDAAFKDETGFELSEWMAAYGELWNIGKAQTGSVKTLALSEIVQRLSASLGWEETRTSRLLAHLSLCPRDNFLDPRPPFEPKDVYPWRFGRPLSYMRRPLVVLPAGESANPNVVWGNRHLLHSSQYLAGQLMGGRYEAASQSLEKLKGQLNKQRGDSFNEKVAEVFNRFPNTVVKPKVRKVKGTRLGASGGLGDIDVLVADKKRRRLLVVECSDLVAGRAPHELANELQALFKGRGTARSKVDKLVNRTQWVRDHLADVLEALGIGRNIKGWKVEPLVVVDEEVFSPHLYPSPVQVLSLGQVRAYWSGTSIVEV